MKKVVISISIFCLILLAAFGAYFAIKQKKLSSSENAKTISDLETQLPTTDSTNQIEAGKIPAQPDETETIIPEGEGKPEMKTVKPNDQSSNLPKPTQKVGDDNKTKTNREASNSNDVKVVSKFVSWGFQKATDRKIKAIIVHTTYNALGGDIFDFDKVMQEWKDAGVAPHYAIDREGTIYQLVADQNIAYHAGSSKLPDGTTDVNGVSIGIEVVNDKNSKFTDEQYKALNSLIASLKDKYSIKYVLGHNDIAPGRKTDPWGIEWDKVKK